MGFLILFEICGNKFCHIFVGHTCVKKINFDFFQGGGVKPFTKLSVLSLAVRSLLMTVAKIVTGHTIAGRMEHFFLFNGIF